MKKFLSAFLILVSFSAFSQQLTEEEEEILPRDIKKNELSLGAFNLVAFGALDIAYERILTPHSSWAIEGFILALNRSDENADEVFDKNVSLTGKYKYFFGEPTAGGFYVNGLAMLSSGDYASDVEEYDSQGNFIRQPKEDYTDLALGFGLGIKFVTEQGFFIDLNSGIGRNLLNNNSPTIVGQFNVNLGFRF